MKRNLLLKLLLCILLVCVSAFCFTACGLDTNNNSNPTNDDSDSIKYSQDLEYKLSEDGTEYALTGIGTCNDTTLNIPHEYNEKPVTSIAGRAFEKCTTLTRVTIPDSITDIGWYAFAHCSSLKSVIIPNSITEIVDKTFMSCYSLTSVIIPNSVTRIGPGSFSYCRSLASIVIPNSLTSIADGAFDACTSLREIIVDETNQRYKSIDGNLYSKDGKTLILYAIGKPTTEYTISDEVTKIENHAFFCCSLTSVTIPNSVTSIGAFAFANSTLLSNIVIPDSMTGLGWCSFIGCSSLTNVTIPKSVRSIGDSAFNNCTSLTNITFNGTLEEWKDVEKGWKWCENTPKMRIVCSDGEVTIG